MILLLKIILVTSLKPCYKNQGLWKKTEYNFTYDKAAHFLSHNVQPSPAKQQELMNTNFQISLKGITVTLQETVEVFYDSAVDESRLTIELFQSELALARCNNFAVYPNLALFLLRNCVGELLDSDGIFSWKISGFLRENGAAVSEIFPLIRYALPKYPWPLQNDEQPWPPTSPNLAGNIIEVFSVKTN